MLASLNLVTLPDTSLRELNVRRQGGLVGAMQNDELTGEGDFGIDVNAFSPEGFIYFNVVTFLKRASFKRALLQHWP